MPGRRTGRMRQRDRFGAMAVKSNGMKLADHIVKSFNRHQLANRQFTDRQNQIGLKQIDFRLQPAEQLSISAGLGTRSPPFGFLPGKQRHTAAM